MSIEYTEDEKQLISELQKNAAGDLIKIASLSAKLMGDMGFNAKLQEDMRSSTTMSPADRQLKNNLAYYCFKTRNYKKAEQAINKLLLIEDQKNHGVEIEDFEKLTLNEINQINQLSTAFTQAPELWGVVFQQGNSPEFNAICDKVTECYRVSNHFKKQAIQVSEYESGDLIVSLTAKSNAMSARKSKLMGHGGRLEEKFITKYLHAAPVYVDRSNAANVQYNLSDINAAQRNVGIELSNILEADSFKIDPSKLVSKEHAKLLEKIEYFKRDNAGRLVKDASGEKIKITWQEEMRRKYTQLSTSLHASQAVQQSTKLLKEMHRLEDTGKRYMSHLTALNNKHSQERDPLRKQQYKAEFNYYCAEMNQFKIDNNSKYTALQKQYKEVQAKTIKIDGKRLSNPMKWVKSAINPMGHTKITNINDFAKFSEKMFHDSHEQRAMICSEFSARAIASTIEQVNRLTALELADKGLCKDGDTIIHNPIGSHERLDTLHPERLVTLLQKSGCAIQTYNKALTPYIQTENTSRAKPPTIVEILPKKLYKILQKSESSAKFQENAEQAMRLYLKHAKVPEEKVAKAVEAMPAKLDKIYTQYKKEPSGIKEHLNAFCNKVLEAVGLRSKDKEIKADLKKVAARDLANKMCKKLSSKVVKPSRGMNAAKMNKAKGAGQSR